MKLETSLLNGRVLLNPFSQKYTEQHPSEQNRAGRRQDTAYPHIAPYVLLYAWIRGRREDPPTKEEILHNEEYRKMIKINADEVQQKEEIRREKEYEEGLVARPIRTQIKGHASATYFGKDKLSSEPTSTANTFQPGGWLPPENSNKKK
ncbi:NADH dehydrogenase [ubiquinone] 1 alpha subcomplex assembly factor 2 isoform X2 [Rhincodon typus]|uniref:NADH dehydrogenase [ubiquinone] 1 alpha subcomplex assembly factor 2 isoform X2 n=1 Tax=Rhincodon typus TaxID=259920 RepID=UPI0020304B95|nr:NADH dehydrogenase [ubiquinone] 1 alpha subcomplex assembly factor 2 isoform X2 [Rhincodon typus]